MNFNFPLLKTIRILLFPFSLVYLLIIFLRNRLFDKGVFKSATFNLPLICIGNIAAGGTGKSPMTEYLVKELKTHFKIATLSRGYKRKTRGYTLANENSNAGHWLTTVIYNDAADLAAPFIHRLVFLLSLQCHGDARDHD